MGGWQALRPGRVYSGREASAQGSGCYAAYYDALEGVVKLEAIHPSVTKEEIEEFLMNFPPFF